MSRASGHIRIATLGAMLLLANAAMAQTPPAGNDSYDAMLGWLAATRIDGQALGQARGVIGVNQAAGDGNQQLNARAIVIGDNAQAQIAVLQQARHDRLQAPAHAQATIADQALAGASGLLAINQASGSGNTAVNAVALALAQQGIREASDEFLSSSAIASAGVQTDHDPQGPATLTRKVGVDGSALQGFEGVLQLNQVAGMGNATENRLLISVQGPP